jgi:hypothetical protein
MDGMVAENPGAAPSIQIDDPAVKMMRQLADELATPLEAPPVASPLHQFAALLAANAGSQLLHQPGGASPAIRAVEAEMAKPAQYRAESQERLDKSRVMRLQAMIRAADNQARQAENEGKWQQAIKMQKDAQEWERELEGIHARNRVAELEIGGKQNMAEIRARGEEDRKTTGMEIAGRERLAQERLSGIASAYGLTKNQVAELNSFNDSLDKVLGGGYVSSVSQGGGVFDPNEAAGIATLTNTLLRRKAEEIKHRDSQFGDVQVNGMGNPDAGANKYKAAYDKYTSGK